MFWCVKKKINQQKKKKNCSIKWYTGRYAKLSHIKYVIGRTIWDYKYAFGYYVEYCSREKHVSMESWIIEWFRNTFRWWFVRDIFYLLSLRRCVCVCVALRTCFGKLSLSKIKIFSIGSTQCRIAIYRNIYVSLFNS